MKYTIEHGLRFIKSGYPLVVNEVTRMKQSLMHVESAHKGEIVIGFLKDHKIRMDLITQNEEVAKMMTSGFIQIRETERLFESSRDNTIFTDELANYIRVEIG